MNYNRNQTSVNSRPSYATIGLLMYVKLQVMDETSYPWIQKHKRIVGSSLHTRLKAPDHGNVRALIGRKSGDRPSSLHTRR